MVQTIGQIESMQGETKNSIDEARMMLSEIYESNIDSFQQCFAEYHTSVMSSVSLPRRLAHSGGVERDSTPFFPSTDQRLVRVDDVEKDLRLGSEKNSSEKNTYALSLKS